MIPAPPLAVIAALVAGGTMPLLLALCARLPLGRAGTSRGFWLATVLSAGIWGVVTFVAVRESGAPYIRPVPADEIVAGALLLAVAMLIVYSFWSLACYGFTVSMLLMLFERRSVTDVDEWASHFGAGGGMPALAQDRVGVLLRAGLAQFDGESLRLTSNYAFRFGRFVALISRIFAVENPE